MTDDIVLERQLEVFKQWYASDVTRERVVVLRAAGGAGLSTFFREVAGAGTASAALLDDAQRHPATLTAHLQRVSQEPRCRLLVGVDTEDDHPARRNVASLMTEHGFEAGVMDLASWSPSRLAAIVTDAARETSSLLVGRFVQRAAGRPKALCQLVEQPQVRRRIVRESIRMHPEEVDRLPAGPVVLVRDWNGLDVTTRTVVVSLWLVGGIATLEEIRAWIGRDPDAITLGAWVSRDDDALWLGKRVQAFLETLEERAAPVIEDVREHVAGRRSSLLSAPRRPSPRAALAPRSTPPARPATFAERRRQAEQLLKAGDRVAGVDALRQLVLDVERERGPSDPFACDVLFELGRQLVLGGHPNGMRVAHTAMSRLAALGRTKQVENQGRALKKAARTRDRST